MKEKKNKTAFLFSGQGQGSIKVGMGRDAWEHSSAARKVFFEADRYLERDISDLCFFGPEEELFKTANSQLASLVVNLAYVATQSQIENEGDVLEFVPQGKIPDYLAGHSVGLVSALVFSGVITFHQALDIVRKRGELMEEACRINPGRMVALVGPPKETVKHLMADYSLGGNFNSETQIILSGRLENIDEALKIINGDKLAKVIPLKTEGAFHSDCMEPAVVPFAEFLEKLSFADPEVPIIGNSRAQLITTGEEAKKELVDHLCRPVMWHQSVEVLCERGVSTFVEMGHGEVLSKNLKRNIIAGSVTVVAISVAVAAYLMRKQKKGSL